MRRSMLFLPGNTPNIIINGDELGADAVILDLEDAVAPSEKDAARILVRNAIRLMKFEKSEVLVRINSMDSEYWKSDLDEIVPLKPDVIMPPKMSCAADVQAIDAYITKLESSLGIESNSVKLMPLIETALGVENAFQIAMASRRVCALQLGGEDLTADLRCKRTREGNEIDYARKRLVCAARAAGVDAYDTPFTDVNDDEGIYADTEYAKSLGFTGKASISPRHVTAINQVFSPSQEDIDYAYEVMEAIRIAKEQGRGAISLRGKMIDAPIVARAQQTIAMAEELLMMAGGGNE
ncbi:citrate lyase subunit beta (plasmid) [Peptoclostridium acidaminophilum DSM 3953]|uniref:Citrate lyase subunit beta n=1 Tax=Peptoclostridium acidaminophilum DSM 3953 TaxID=1286171 RepID=W8TK19_PEPAC|nr:CoA ester lyase [Peptoclostridium acidaminophilum]AHM58098.1 citrate lyase subunit beta [Peptoclostridium acidaminophilum DSM 3953]